MKSILSFVCLLLLIYFSFYSLMPSSSSDATAPTSEFSTERALQPLKEISKKPHYITSAAHGEVREYLLDQLRSLGLTPQVQEGYIVNTGWGNSAAIDKPKNILAKIKGSEAGKALVLMSHYDSALVPSFGASDAGSGVVTILEGVRAFLASGLTPKNDIIILFTDAEEVGLDGAKLFVRDHPWAKNVGLALNFEARGSGGPSNMIVETNGGNAQLIKAFKAARPDYPVASSLMYSIYKMLPNDTDSTILREEGNIDSFFFAFIDDHYDYHTSQDNFENLDRNTLEHQGTYLMPLLSYFANADLANLKATEDYVYVNFPFINMISYPFSWVLPMALIALVIFIVLLVVGIRQKAILLKHVGRGFLAFTVVLLLSGLVGYFGWSLLLKLYPQYSEIQHGFTYNGHVYIGFFTALSCAIAFFCYHKIKFESQANALVAPLFYWILINILLALYLKGGAYFIIPVYFGLLSFWVLLRQEKPNPYLMLLFTIPAIFIFSPLIQFFPIGLGLSMLVGSALLTILVFGLLIPVIGFYKQKKLLAYLSLFLALGLFIKAHVSSGFDQDRKKPNSLVYYQNVDKQEAYWLTYDAVLDNWTKEYLGEDPAPASNYVESAAGSKYNTGYRYAAKAPLKGIANFKTILKKDTVVEDLRSVDLTVIPQRSVNLIRFYADKSVIFDSFRCNELLLPVDSIRSNNVLFRYYVSDQDSLNISYTITADQKVRFNVLEYSYDLMEHPNFTIDKRPDNAMPKPFVNTDAIVLTKEIDIDLLNKE